MIDVTFQKQVNAALTRFFAEKRRRAGAGDRRLPQLVDQIADVTLRGGDRLRPYMCWLGYQAAQNEAKSVPKSFMPILVALELFHTFALIHDDIMDEARTRRGGPTIHAYFTQNLRNRHLAISLAILAGDWSLNWAQESFAGAVTTATTLAALTLFDQMVNEVIEGQTSDVWGMKSRGVPALLAMYRAKSGNYAVTWPLRIGAAWGGAPAGMLQTLTQYGEAVGLAFQLKDDLLGVFADSKALGKSVTSDITEGKWTLIIAWTYERLDGQKRKQLDSILGKKSASPRQINWVRQQMEDTGAKQRVETMMQTLAADAIKTLAGTALKNTPPLVEVARFIISRTV